MGTVCLHGTQVTPDQISGNCKMGACRIRKVGETPYKEDHCCPVNSLSLRETTPGMEEVGRRRMPKPRVGVRDSVKANTMISFCSLILSFSLREKGPIVLGIHVSIECKY